MIDPQVIVKANVSRRLLTVLVSAINSPDWDEIVSTRLELFRDSTYTNRFEDRTTSHYKARIYLSNETPEQTIYGRVTLTKSDNSVHVSTFNFVVPKPVIGMIEDGANTAYVTSMRKMDKSGVLSPRNYANTVDADIPPYIEIVADEDGEMLVGNQWDTPIIVTVMSSGAEIEVALRTQATIAVSEGDKVRVREKNVGSTFKAFTDYAQPLCKGVSAHISVFPSISKFTANNTAPSNFFYGFNQNGSLTSLPEGSFDIHKLTAGGANVFAYFNASGALTALPAGSFDTSNLTAAGSGFFRNFNAQGALSSLPDYSFDFDNMQTGIDATAFYQFNYNGALVSLPTGSFGFSGYTGAFGGFYAFNNSGLLLSLPEGSFHVGSGAVVGGRSNSPYTYGSLFASFNANGRLTSLPDKSFNFVINNLPMSAFYNFNSGGLLTSLPAGSFKISSTVTQCSSYAFADFNRNGALTSLPAGSFNTENITLLDMAAFSGFNRNGALTSLPAGSFNFNAVTTIYSNVLASFNQTGALTALPKNSFAFTNLTAISSYSFAMQFNYGGALERLPIGAFSVDGVTSTSQTNLFLDFNKNGKLTKSDTDYNARFVALWYQNTADYYDPSTQTSYSETIGIGNPFKYWEADYFGVSYTPSVSYTTDISAEYLSGQTVTFSAEATDPAYTVAPTITTSGGVAVAVTDNRDGTFTFVMPQDNIVVAFAVITPPATISIVAEEAGNIVIANKWITPIIVENATQASTPVTVAKSNTAQIPVNINDEIIITESAVGTTFRNWDNNSRPIATGVLCHISEMSPMNRFTLAADGTQLGPNAFRNFCAGQSQKGVTVLPAGSFDLSGVSLLNSSAFYGFNSNGLLTSLPAGSFNTSNAVLKGSSFSNFNYSGALVSLPAGSFHISSANTIAEARIFEGFNRGGALTSLPDGSFNTDGFTSAQLSVFADFNNQGDLVSLPNGSFDTSNFTTVGNNFFYGFNSNGALTSLPAGSFGLSGATKVGNYFFASFNQGGALTSLPAGSFNIENISSLGTNFFYAFNLSGALTSLPAGSFDTSNMTLTSNSFSNFNISEGKLTKSTSSGSYNPNFINTSSGNITAHYWQGGTQYEIRTIAPGDPFYYETT